MHTGNSQKKLKCQKHDKPLNNNEISLFAYQIGNDCIIKFSKENRVWG